MLSPSVFLPFFEGCCERVVLLKQSINDLGRVPAPRFEGSIRHCFSLSLRGRIDFHLRVSRATVLIEAGDRVRIAPKWDGDDTLYVIVE